MKKIISFLAIVSMFATFGIASASSSVGLTCSPSIQTVSVGSYVSFLGVSPTASGQGFGRKNVWSAPGGTLVGSNTSGFTFVTSYAVAGNYTVTVTNSGQSASCAVIVQ